MIMIINLAPPPLPIRPSIAITRHDIGSGIVFSVTFQSSRTGTGRIFTAAPELFVSSAVGSEDHGLATDGAFVIVGIHCGNLPSFASAASALTSVGKSPERIQS